MELVLSTFRTRLCGQGNSLRLAPRGRVSSMTLAALSVAPLRTTSCSSSEATTEHMNAITAKLLEVSRPCRLRPFEPETLPAEGRSFMTRTQGTVTAPDAHPFPTRPA